MQRTLVIGYGNVDRNDDGVAHNIVNALRSRLGQEPLDVDETGLEQRGCPVDSCFVLQLVPELLDVAADYGRVVFVDAHVHPDLAEVHCAPVQPEYSAAAFTHHMTPAMFLALREALYRCPSPETGEDRLGDWLVSVRGHRFDFVRGLSDATAANVPAAVDCILGLLADGE